MIAILFSYSRFFSAQNVLTYNIIKEKPSQEELLVVKKIIAISFFVSLATVTAVRLGAPAFLADQYDYTDYQVWHLCDDRCELKKGDVKLLTKDSEATAYQIQDENTNEKYVAVPKRDGGL